MKLIETINELISETNLGDVMIVFKNARTEGIHLVLETKIELEDFSKFWPMKGEMAIDLINESYFIEPEEWDPDGVIPKIMLATNAAQLPEGMVHQSDFIRELAQLKYEELK